MERSSSKQLSATRCGLAEGHRNTARNSPPRNASQLPAVALSLVALGLGDQPIELASLAIARDLAVPFILIVFIKPGAQFRQFFRRKAWRLRPPAPELSCAASLQLYVNLAGAAGSAKKLHSACRLALTSGEAAFFERRPPMAKLRFSVVALYGPCGRRGDKRGSDSAAEGLTGPFYEGRFSRDLRRSPILRNLRHVECILIDYCPF